MTEVNPPAGKLSSVSKTYGATIAVDSVDLEVVPGEVLVVVGPNGSGKTTSLEMLAGLRRPESGEARVCEGFVPGSKAARLATGVQLQESRLPTGIKAREAIRAKASLFADPGPVDAIVESIGLPRYMNRAVDKLSGGWQRRLDVAIACIGRPRLLVLDEPTSGVDPDGRAEMWHFFRAVRSAGAGIVTSTHDLSEAEAFADRMVVMSSGRVTASGTVPEILSDAGGSWRLRLVEPDEVARRVVSESKMETRDSISASTVFGDREEINRLTERLETLHEAGQLGYRDLLKGAVRLEDVFASMVVRSDDGSTARY